MVATLTRRLEAIEARLPAPILPDRLIVAELPDGSRFVADPRCPMARLPDEDLAPAWRRLRPADESSGLEPVVFKVSSLAAFPATLFAPESTRPGDPGAPDMLRPSEAACLEDFADHPWSRSAD